jgi:hypothetical protein
MLAELAQISVDGISALERGCRCTPRRETVTLLTRALGLEGESRLEFEASATHERTAWPHEPPFATASFVGRERELIELAGLVEKHRMVTITGPGGIGKTQTAVQVAKRLVESDKLPICAVGLAPIEDPSLVIATIVLALALPENPEQKIIDTLAEFIRDKALKQRMSRRRYWPNARSFESWLPVASRSTSARNGSSGYRRSAHPARTSIDSPSVKLPSTKQLHFSAIALVRSIIALV